MRINTFLYHTLAVLPRTVVALIVVLTLTINMAAYSQSTDETLIYLDLDTLSLDEVNPREGPSFRAEYPLDINFDSAHFELVVKNQIIAIVPNYLRRTIVEKFVSKTSFVIENLPDGKILLRVIKFIEVPPYPIPK